jgi:hypothetical protein
MNMHCDVTKSFVSGKLMIDSKNESNTPTLKTLTVRPGSNTIDSSKFLFENETEYALKMEVKYKDENNATQTYHSVFSHGTSTSNQDTQSYTFLYREDGGDELHTDSAVVNPNEIENNSTIIISAEIVDPVFNSLTNELHVLESELADLVEGTPEYTAKQVEITAKQAEIDDAYLVNSLTNELHVLESELAELFEGTPAYTAKQVEIVAKQAAIDGAENDSRKPHTLSFTFDETDNYYGEANDTDNSEQLVSYSADLAYQPNGRYLLENNQLENGRSYLVTVTAIYSDGEVESKTLNEKVNVLIAPAIEVTAYGLDSSSITGADQTGAGAGENEDTISTVMKVKITAASSPNMLQTVDNEITFNLKQNGVLMYSATKDVIAVSEADSNGKITYTVLKEDLTTEWQDPYMPLQNEDGSYTYDVTAVASYSLNEDSNDIVKTSNIVNKNFTSDIIPLVEVTISNAWIAASVTTVDGQRIVDLTDELSADGYEDAPPLAIVGQFEKNDFFGSGIENGFYTDLDKIDTKFKVQRRKRIPNSEEWTLWGPVESLHIILGAADVSDQENYVALMSAEMQSDTNGLYSNPDASAFENVEGSEQPDVYFMIPSNSYYQQGDSVQVRVQIVTPNGETTWPSATESNENIVVNKVNIYTMAIETDSEPSFTGSGEEGVLEIPINNPTSASDQLYLESVTFESNLASPNDSVTETVEEEGNDDGVLNLTVTNPSARGVNESITYTVYYTLSDPNNYTTIRGPVSEEYTISVADEPTSANFTITDYQYNNFNDDGESSFEFKVSFQDYQDTTIDGINVHFKSDNDDEDSSNNIQETLVATVSRYNSDGSEHDADDLIEVILQTVGPSSSAATDGVYVLDINGNSSAKKWNNFTSGTIVFRAYKTPDVSSFNDGKVEVSGNDYEQDINNMPVIDPVDPESVLLTGGVIQSYNATQVSWVNDLEIYDSVSNVEASHELFVNSQDQTSNINEGSDSYNVDISGAASNYTVAVKVKIVAENGDVFYSEPTIMAFDSVSVNTSSLDVSVVRGSNLTVLNASYSPLVVNGGDEANLIVTSVKIVDNQDPENEDPEDEGVNVLLCTSTEDDVQPESTVNVYNISSYQKGDDIDVAVMVEAGVRYQVNDGEYQNSIPLYMTLSTAENYVVAKKLSVNIPDTYVVENNEVKITLNINTNGLWNEGLQGCFIVLTQDGDYTNEDDDDADGASAMLQFDSSQAVTTYATQESVTPATNSTDNMAAGESFVLTDENGITYNLTLGTLDSSDESVLTVPADADFDFTKSFTMLAVASTRLGLDSSIKEMEPL